MDMDRVRKAQKVRIGQTNAAILAGEMDLATWSDEELLRGMRKDKNGRWSGRPPVVVPKAIHNELVHRKMMQAHELLRDNLCEAINVLVTIAKDKRTDAAVRVKAANTIIERVLGKVPERVHLAQDEQPAFVTAILNSVVGIVPGEHRDAIPADHEDVTEDIVQRENHVIATRRRRRGA